MRLGWPLVITITLVPLILWLRIMPVSDRFDSFGAAATSVGQLTGLAGMAMFATAMILSARLKIFDGLFGGMNRAYIVHHQAGGLAFILLMIHPLASAAVYAQNSLESAALFLWPGPDWALNLGIASLMTLMTLLILTYYVELPYQFWRFTHKFLGLAFFLGGLHSFFIPSDISRDPILRVYMLSLTAIGLIAYLYRTLLGRWLVPRLHYILTQVRQLKPDILELTLSPADPDKTLDFKAGQFVFISFQGKNIDRETHPFSISSAPAKTGFRLTVKSLGDYTRWLPQIPPNTPALVEGPFGRFATDFVLRRQYIWIAGGIGITPFVAMARNMVKNGFTADLYYCCKNPTEAVYLDELTRVATSGVGLRLTTWYSQTQGRLTSQTIARMSGLTAKDFFLCGPPPMMLTIKKQLKSAGVPGGRIHSEEFSMD